jgi:hypothetical protein
MTQDAKKPEEPEEEPHPAEIVELETFTFDHPASAEDEPEAATVSLAPHEPPQEPASEPAAPERREAQPTQSFAAYAAPARDVEARGAWYAETEPVMLGRREDLDRSDSLEVRRIIAAAVRETVECEGPIATSRLARSIGRRFGFDRVASGRQALILREVPAQLIKSSDLGDFVWPAGVTPEVWRGYRRTPEEISRPLADIAPEEIVNAMSDLAVARTFTEDEELFRATLLVFGQRRMTSQTVERLTLCRELAERRDRLIRAPDGRLASGA